MRDGLVDHGACSYGALSYEVAIGESMKRSSARWIDLETDDQKLPSCLEEAKAAIDRRLQEIQADRNSASEELHAIADALNGLKVLRMELEKRPR